jgi:hypothetical protein
METVRNKEIDWKNNLPSNYFEVDCVEVECEMHNNFNVHDLHQFFTIDLTH